MSTSFGFFLFMVACITLAMIGVVFPALFWWSILGAGALWAIGIVVETVWHYRHPGPGAGGVGESTPRA